MAHVTFAATTNRFWPIRLIQNQLWRRGRSLLLTTLWEKDRQGTNGEQLTSTLMKMRVIYWPNYYQTVRNEGDMFGISSTTSLGHERHEVWLVWDIFHIPEWVCFSVDCFHIPEWVCFYVDCFTSCVRVCFSLWLVMSNVIVDVGLWDANHKSWTTSQWLNECTWMHVS